MPELPDIEAYCAALRPRLVGEELNQIRLRSPFVLRSVDPPLSAVNGQMVKSIDRLGKRIVVGFDGDLFLVFHLMIAGRLRWRDSGKDAPSLKGRSLLARFDFSSGWLSLTEAAKEKRAALHVVQGRHALSRHDPGGLEVLAATAEEFAARLRQENHTLKRALTDPRLFSGIGNAYSDEILHHAQLSPVTWTSRLNEDQVSTLFSSTVSVLTEWRNRLAAEAETAFPKKVTAFRPEMVVHGKYNQPCPRCGHAVQRIVYASNETNYCAACQTGGKLLADRNLSRLLKADWPKTLEELELARIEPP